MSTRKTGLEPITNYSLFEKNDQKLDEFETVHKDEIEYIGEHNEQIAEQVLKFGSLGAITGIMGGTALFNTNHQPLATTLVGAGVAAGIGGRIASHYLKNWEEKTEQFDFERTEKSYASELENTEEVGVNYLRQFREPDWIHPNETMKVTGNYVEQGLVTDGEEAAEIYRQVTDSVDAGEIGQYLSFQDLEDDNRYDLQLYADKEPIVGFTGYTDRTLEEFKEL